MSGALRARHREILLHTGQHYDDDLSDRFFRELRMAKPDYQLGVRSGQHGAQTARMLIGIEAVISKERPDRVLVYGDTNSTLAGALAAAKLNVPIAHVEAGLRSFNRAMPEEINRILTDHLSDLLFCPSETAACHLKREGITKGVHVVGDVMAEALAQFGRQHDRRLPDAIDVQPGAYVLATVHRAENTDDHIRLTNILDAMDALDEPVVFTVHPRVRTAIEMLGRRLRSHVLVVPPVGYGDMVALAAGARVVMTDSGGLQKEAYWLGVPCVTLRNETEWTETVACGWNVLVGADRDRIVEGVRRATRPALRPSLYGDGHAVQSIVELLE